MEAQPSLKDLRITTSLHKVGKSPKMPLTTALKMKKVCSSTDIGSVQINISTKS